MESSTLGIREDIGFGAAVPRPARSSAYASPAVSPRPAQGWLPAWAGSPLAGQDSHLLDDKQSFMKASHPPIPFDPQGLVALDKLSIAGIKESRTFCTSLVAILRSFSGFNTSVALWLSSLPVCCSPCV